MRRRLRHVHLEGAQWGWSARPIDPTQVRLTLWHPERKRQPWATVRVPFDDPWHSYGPRLSAYAQGDGEAADAAFQLAPLTPARVVEIIEAIRAFAPEGGAFVWDTTSAQPTHDTA